MVGSIAIENSLAVGKTDGAGPVINDLVVLGAKVDLVIGGDLGRDQFWQPVQQMCPKGMQILNGIGLAQKLQQGPEVVLAQAQQGWSPLARDYTPKCVFAPVERAVTTLGLYIRRRPGDCPGSTHRYS